MFVLVCSVRCQPVGYLGGTKTMACLKAKAMVKKVVGLVGGGSVIDGSIPSSWYLFALTFVLFLYFSWNDL